MNGIRRSFLPKCVAPAIKSDAVIRIIVIPRDCFMSVFESILKANAHRDRSLVKLKFSRMARTPFAFFRGTDHLFGDAWSELAPRDPGPNLLISGDLHIENFGAYRTESGEWRFDVNDFDAALIAPCGLDVVRCASSILLAAEDWKLTPVTAAGLVLVFLGHYRKTVLRALDDDKIGSIKKDDSDDPISKALGGSKRATKKRLIAANTRLRRNGDRIFVKDKLRRIVVKERVFEAVAKAVKAYAPGTTQPDSFHVCDVIERIAGIGSLGLKRYLVLVDDGEGHDERLYDIKQCIPPALLKCSHVKQPEYSGNEALRVVCAQRHLQGEAAVGLDVFPMGDHFLRIREMIPSEDRCQIDRFRKKIPQLKDSLEIIAKVVAWSHLRGARFEHVDCRNELGDWASGSSLDAVLKSAVAYAARTTSDYNSFLQRYRKWNKTAKNSGKKND